MSKIRKPSPASLSGPRGPRPTPASPAAEPSTPEPLKTPLAPQTAWRTGATLPSSAASSAVGSQNHQIGTQLAGQPLAQLESSVRNAIAPGRATRGLSKALASRAAALRDGASLEGVSDRLRRVLQGASPELVQAAAVSPLLRAVDRIAVGGEVTDGGWTLLTASGLAFAALSELPPTDAVEGLDALSDALGRAHGMGGTAAEQLETLGVDVHRAYVRAWKGEKEAAGTRALEELRTAPPETAEALAMAPAQVGAQMAGTMRMVAGRKQAFARMSLGSSRDRTEDAARGAARDGIPTLIAAGGLVTARLPDVRDLRDLLGPESSTADHPLASALSQARADVALAFVDKLGEPDTSRLGFAAGHLMELHETLVRLPEGSPTRAKLEAKLESWAGATLDAPDARLDPSDSAANRRFRREVLLDLASWLPEGSALAAKATAASREGARPLFQDTVSELRDDGPWIPGHQKELVSAAESLLELLRPELSPDETVGLEAALREAAEKARLAS